MSGRGGLDLRPSRDGSSLYVEWGPAADSHGFMLERSGAGFHVFGWSTDNRDADPWSTFDLDAAAADVLALLVERFGRMPVAVVDAVESVLRGAL